MEITSQSSLETTYTDPDSGEDVTETKTSNSISTTNLTLSITKEKSSAKTSVKRNEEVSQDNTITNGSTLTLTSITFTETLSEGMSFVAGSVELNGESQPDADPTAGIELTDMNPDDSVLLTYSVKFNEDSTESTGTSTAAIAYSVGDEAFTENTNTVDFTVVENLINLVIEADKTAVISGGTIHYTVNITNAGTFDNKNLTFTNPIPDGTSFVAESVIVDDAPDPSLDPSVGFALPDMAQGGSAKVEFDVTVN